MESGSQLGTYVAYFLICSFLLLLAVAAARSYGMIMSLVLMVFMGNTKPTTETASTDSDTNDAPRSDEPGRNHSH